MIGMYGYYLALACNPCKDMSVFKIKHNFYYKNINDQLNYFKKQHITRAYVQIRLKLNTNFIIKI